MMVRRLLTVAAFSGLGMVVGAGVAAGDDLDEYLQRAAESDYAGSQIVVSIWDGRTETMVIDIEHAGSRFMVGSEEHLVDAGTVVKNGGSSALSVAAWNRYASDRYEAAEAVRVRRLGREAESVAIVEDGTIRARILFDVATGAPLATEIYDGGGRLFRLSAMTQFDATPRKIYAGVSPEADVYDVMVPVSVATLPKHAAGYTLADVYSGPDDVVHAFFTDGLFTFSIFEIEGDVTADRFEDAVTMEVRGARYQRFATPTDVWLQWTADDTSYVLVGDLPPDHLDDVLHELPKPSRPNLLERMWRGLFG